MRADPTRPPLPRLARCSDACREVLVLREGRGYLDRVLLHDVDSHEQRARIVYAGTLVIDLLMADVSVDGHGVNLTPTEFRVLAALAATPDVLVRSPTLARDVWGWPEGIGMEGHGIRVNIARCRAKLGYEGDRIVTRPALGYQLDTQSLVPPPPLGWNRRRVSVPPAVSP